MKAYRVENVYEGLNAQKCISWHSELTGVDIKTSGHTFSYVKFSVFGTFGR